MGISATKSLPGMDRLLGSLNSHDQIYGLGAGKGSSKSSGVGRNKGNILGAVPSSVLPGKHMDKLEAVLKHVLEALHAPFMRPLKIANEVSGGILGEFAHGFVDKAYITGYRFFPHKLIGNSLKSIKDKILGISQVSDVTKKVSDHKIFKKLNFKIDEKFAEEILNIIGKAYDPNFIKHANDYFMDENGDMVFFSKALKQGELPYQLLAKHVIEEAQRSLFEKGGQLLLGKGDQDDLDIDAEMTNQNLDEKVKKEEKGAKNNIVKNEAKRKTEKNNKTKERKAETKKKLENANSGREKAKVYAEDIVDSTYETVENVADRAGKAVTATKSGAQKTFSSAKKFVNSKLNNDSKDLGEIKEEKGGLFGGITKVIGSLVFKTRMKLQHIPLPGFKAIFGV